MKWLIKMLLPKPKTIADMAADTLAKAINDSGKGDTIQKYTQYVESWDKIQDKIVKWLADGKIDDAEKAEISKALEPICEKILEEIKK